jgi:phage gp16-like protein
MESEKEDKWKNEGQTESKIGDKTRQDWQVREKSGPEKDPEKLDSKARERTKINGEKDKN